MGVLRGIEERVDDDVADERRRGTPLQAVASHSV
jgi:hypothetical protein